MTRILHAAAAAAAIALLAACAGTKFDWEQARAVRAGMTADELQQRMGKPYAVTTRGNQTTWTYSYADVMQGSKAVSFVLQDDKVVQTPTIPSSF